MIQRNISMPHPVLGVPDDFIQGAFKTSFKITPNRTTRSYDFHSISSEVTNSYIEHLVNGSILDFVLKISCAPTYKTWTVINKGHFSIADSDLHSVIEVESYLVANQRIDKYYHETFSPVFENIQFQIETGDIVAMTGPQRVLLPKENERVTLGSIFKFARIPISDENQVLYFNFDDDQITVYYSVMSSEFDPVNFLFDKVQGVPYTALNIYILPALTEAFAIMKDNPDDYMDKRWYQVLDSILPPDDRNENAFINAQMAISTGFPVNLAVEEIMKLKEIA